MCYPFTASHLSLVAFEAADDISASAFAAGLVLAVATTVVLAMTFKAFVVWRISRNMLIMKILRMIMRVTTDKVVMTVVTMVVVKQVLCSAAGGVWVVL